MSYHDLNENPDSEMTKIRAFCQIEQSRTCQLPERDTQANSGLSRETLNPFKIDLKPEEVAKLDRALTTLGLPSSSHFPIRGKDFNNLINFKLYDT